MNLGEFTSEEVQRLQQLLAEGASDEDLVLELIALGRARIRKGPATPLPFIGTLYSELGIGLGAAKAFAGHADWLIAEFARKPEQKSIVEALRRRMQSSADKPADT